MLIRPSWRPTTASRKANTPLVWGKPKWVSVMTRKTSIRLSLTALERLVPKTPNLSYNDIGRLEVGTETLVDKSKSVKSVLMKLFEESGNSDVEGVDSTNACYAARQPCSTASRGSSRRTGTVATPSRSPLTLPFTLRVTRVPPGAPAPSPCWSVPHAPLVLDRGLRATHVQHAYDFYKPDMSSEYPTVDGKLSIQCYLEALDKCYKLYKHKAAKLSNNKGGDRVLPRHARHVGRLPRRLLPFSLLQTGPEVVCQVVSQRLRRRFGGGQERAVRGRYGFQRRRVVQDVLRQGRGEGVHGSKQSHVRVQDEAVPPDGHQRRQHVHVVPVRRPHLLPGQLSSGTTGRQAGRIVQLRFGFGLVLLQPPDSRRVGRHSDVAQRRATQVGVAEKGRPGSLLQVHARTRGHAPLGALQTDRRRQQTGGRNVVLGRHRRRLSTHLRQGRISQQRSFLKHGLPFYHSKLRWWTRGPQSRR